MESLPQIQHSIFTNMKEIQFFQTKHILLEQFKSYYNIDDNWLISLQSGEHFQHVQSHYRNGGQDGADQLPADKTVDRPNISEELQNNHIGDEKSQQKCDNLSMLLTRLNTEEKHVPSTNTFIVFQVKKSYKMKVFRYYQCRCDKLDKLKQNATCNNVQTSQKQRSEEKTNGKQPRQDASNLNISNNEVLKKMIE